MIDLDKLKRLALAAQSEDGEATRHVAMTPAEAALASALDPATVLELVDVAALAGRVDLIVKAWRAQAAGLRIQPEPGDLGYAAALDACAAELLELKERAR